MLDEFRSTYITWDKATSRIYSPVTANASDENGRKLVVQIVNGGQVEDLTGATLHLYWETRDKTHDGLDVFDAVDLKKGEFELSYTTGMLSNHGALNANLVLIDTVGRVVSERFKITVTEGIDSDAIQSENSFSSLTKALIDVSNLEQNYAPRLNDLTAQLQQTEQDLNAQLAQKALEEDLIVERNRINNLSTLAEGSTTGDAELIDIRAGENGKNYASAGESVRKQFGSVNKQLADVDGRIDTLIYPMKNLINNDGLEIIQTSGDSNPMTAAVDLIEGHKYFYKINLKSDSALVSTRVFDGTWLFNHKHSGSGSYEAFAGIMTATQTRNGEIQLIRDIRESGDRTTNSAQYPILIDLTKTFGEGNEPDLSKIDEIISSYPNSWFSGTVSVNNNKFMFNKLEEQGKQFTSTNAIVNGDFKYGIYGWSTNGAQSTLLRSGDSIVLRGSLGTKLITATSASTLDYVTGDKIYYKATMRALSNEVGQLLIGLHKSSTISEEKSSNFNVDDWVNLSKVYEATDDGFCSFQFKAYSKTNGTGNESIQIKNAMMVNLTKTFGAGNEPTKSEFEQILSKYPNSWFDGTVNFIINMRDVYDIAKNNANKTEKFVTQKYSHSVPVAHDSERVNYTGEWTVGTRATAIKGSFKGTYEEGATATLDFCGDFVGVVIEASNGSGIAEIILDGESQGYVDCYSANTTAMPWVIFRKRVLPGYHTIQIKCTGTKNDASTSHRIKLDHFFYNIQIHNTTVPQQSGVILTFDDNSRAVYQYAAPKLQEYGFKSTSYILPHSDKLKSEIPPEGAVDYWKIWWLRTIDFEVSSHSFAHLHLPELTEDELRDDFRKANEWLSYNGMDCGHMAPPYNHVDEKVIKIAKEFCSSMVGRGDYAFDPNNFDPYQIPRYNVEETTNFDELKGVLRDVKENNKVIVLMFHDIVTSSNIVDTQISKTKFDELIDYIASLGLKGMRMKDFIPLT